MIITKRFLIGTLFRKLPNGDDHGIVISDSPETLIKQPVSILAQR